MGIIKNELLLKDYINDIIFYIAINFWYIFLITAIIFLLLTIKLLKDYINLKFRLKEINKNLLEPLAQIRESDEFEGYLSILDRFLHLEASALYSKRGEVYFLDIRSRHDADVGLEQRLYKKDLVEHKKVGKFERYIFHSDEAALVCYAKEEIDLEYYRGILETIVAYYEKVATKAHRSALEAAEERSKDIMQRLFNIRSTTETFLKFVVSLLRKKTDARIIVLSNKLTKKQKVFRYGDETPHKKRFYIRNTPYILDIFTKTPLDSATIDEIGKFLDLAGSYYENLDTDSKMVRNYIEFLRFSVRALEVQSPFFINHSQKVRIVSIEIAKNLLLDEKSIAALALGAEFHDVGMIGKIENILDKKHVKGSELDIIKYHPVIGALLVEPIDGAYAISDIIRYHHERYDGKGYPYGISGKAFPLGAQIVALAEFYVGITSPRAYRKPLSHDEAIQKIAEQKNALVHERVIEAFLENHSGIKSKLELIDAKQS